MDYSKLLDELKEASLFDLYRLITAIERELENPYRIANIRSQLQLGQKVTYFDRKENREIKAEVLELKRTRVLVRHEIDGARWTVPFHWINLSGIDTEIYSRESKKGLTKNEIKVGDTVSFKDQQNREVVGEVQRLNPKSVTVIDV